jgi:hypothetical protein
MDLTAGVGALDRLGEDAGAVDGGRRRGHAGDEDVRAGGLEDLLDAAPVRDLEGRDRGADGDLVETEEAVAEDDGILRRLV